MNNASFETADRGTHVKIVLVSLVASIVVLIVGISIHSTAMDAQTARLQSHGPATKAGPSMAATRSNFTVR